MDEKIKKRIETSIKRKLMKAEIEYIEDWEKRVSEKYNNRIPFSKYVICLCAFEMSKIPRNKDERKDENRHKCPLCNSNMIPSGSEPWRVWMCFGFGCKERFICFENGRGGRFYVKFKTFDQGVMI